MSSRTTVLITGATGKQGGSVIAALLVKNIVAIRALTRSVDSPAAHALSSKGVEVVQGSFHDKSSIIKALEGVSAAFLISTPDGSGGAAQEETEGRLFIDAAKEVNLPHLVFTSVEGADRSTGIAHFESKLAIEEYLRASGIRYTIIRPVAFMENFKSPDKKLPMLATIFESALKGKPLQMISIKDIGFFAARALEEPLSFDGRIIPLAGDELNMNQVAAIYGVKDWKAPEFDLEKLPADRQTMLKWWESHGYKANIDANRKEHPGLLTFTEWLKEDTEL